MRVHRPSVREMAYEAIAGLSSLTRYTLKLDKLSYEGCARIPGSHSPDHVLLAVTSAPYNLHMKTNYDFQHIPDFTPLFASGFIHGSAHMMLLF